MAQIQLKCPNCQQIFDGETNENADSSARIKTKCPACGIAFQFKNDENAEDSGREWGKPGSLPEDFEIILNMEMHSAFDLPKRKKAKSGAFASLRMLFQSLWAGFRLAVIVLIPLSWFGIAGLFLEKMPAYAKWISLWILPALLVVLTIILAIRCGKRVKAAHQCPCCGKCCTMAKIKEAPLVQSELVPRPILTMTILKCSRCGAEVTRKESYPSSFVSLAWCASLVVMIAVYALLVSAIPGVMMKLTALFVMMVTWGVLLFAPVTYGDPLRIVPPDDEE